jgi:hypothetical protein
VSLAILATGCGAQGEAATGPASFAPTSALTAEAAPSSTPDAIASPPEDAYTSTTPLPGGEQPGAACEALTPATDAKSGVGILLAAVNDVNDEEAMRAAGAWSKVASATQQTAATLCALEARGDSQLNRNTVCRMSKQYGFKNIRDGVAAKIAVERASSN